MDNTREKLIDLLTDRIPGIDNELRYVDDERVERLADHLIANCVTIATDNNVGDKLTPTAEDLSAVAYKSSATNADRIRAMSDEKLAEWLLEIMKHKVACFGEGAFKYTPCRNVEHDCIKCGLQWLQQPAEKG